MKAKSVYNTIITAKIRIPQRKTFDYEAEKRGLSLSQLLRDIGDHKILLVDAKE